MGWRKVVARASPRSIAEKMHLLMASNLQSASLQVPEGISSFQALREELEMSSAEEQLCRLRRRVALAQFYDDYTRAQADPHSFLYPEQKKISVKSLTATRKRKRASSSNVAKRKEQRAFCQHSLFKRVHYRRRVR
jgi:hypothetical protein